ncbi:MAG: alkaline phosphatase family protein [Pseudomonadota bacterium]
MPRNVLFIMADQLRWDYLGCAGHPHIKTPNIDRLATKGVRFDQCYVQSPVCGPSRMSTYTGRYVRSHGATWNNTPLRVGEWTLGEHLENFGARAVLCGKTHFQADVEGMARLGIDPDSEKGKKIAQCGFEIWDRLDGLHPLANKQPSHYQDYLRSKGYEADNPWHDWANSAEDENGEVLSGWLMENVNRPIRVKEEDSETAYSTTRAMEFIDQAGDQPWCLHLSYIKPHWPYMSASPYNDMYGPKDVIPPVRSEAEKNAAHPIQLAYQKSRFGKVMQRDEVRERVIPAYMGLITQIDDHIGRLMDWLEQTGRDKDTMIVVTSDHGDYLGDHWQGEKELFHDASARVPLIIVNPDTDADSTRGTVDRRLVEAIDLAPTFVDWMGGEIKQEILEGRSLLPLLQGRDVDWRNVCFSEYDYSWRFARTHLDVPVKDARMVMAYDGRWKYVECAGFRPMLFDLELDPDELSDLGEDPTYEAVRLRLREEIFQWSQQHHNRTTISDDGIAGRAGREHRKGIYIGFWDQAEHDSVGWNDLTGN